jgi:septal ring factor EnvC (AmiA/AmiB activator)
MAKKLHFLEAAQHQRNVRIKQLRDDAQDQDLPMLLQERAKARKELNAARLDREQAQRDLPIGSFLGAWWHD